MNEAEGEYEVEAIVDHKDERITRTGRSRRRYRIRWKGYGEEHDSWEFEEDLHCGALLFEYDQQLKRRNRLGAMMVEEPQIPTS